ncbi:MAG: hypothetical protein ACREH4_12300 [Vitreimonas sp.]
MTRAGWTQAEREWSRRPERVEGREMGWGRWARLAGGSCDGYGLEIGHLLRFSIVAGDRTNWRLSLNAREIGAYPDLKSAIAAADAEARTQMTIALEHWTRFQAEPADSML